MFAIVEVGSTEKILPQILLPVGTVIAVRAVVAAIAAVEAPGIYNLKDKLIERY